MRILIVDDEDSVLTTLAANLELEGFEVVEAKNGPSALALVANGAFDLVLSDVRMPGMNGVDLYRGIRRLDPHLPVILMTAFSLESLIEQALREGVFTVLPKPFDVEELIRTAVRAASRPVVLLVDGDRDGERTRAALEAVGVRCKLASEIDTALAVLRDDTVDVCIVNVAVAPDLAQELVDRIHRADRAVSVIAMVPNGASGALRRAARSSVYAYVAGRAEPSELVQVIAGARRGAPAGSATS